MTMQVRTIATIATAVALCAACGGGSGKKTPAPTAPSRASSSSPATAAIPADPSLANSQGAIRDVTGVSCTADASGAWSAVATVKNTGATAISYAVQFNVVNTATSSVVGRAQHVYQLAPGKSADVRFAKFYTSTATGLSCVPHVVKGN